MSYDYIVVPIDFRDMQIKFDRKCVFIQHGDTLGIVPTATLVQNRDNPLAHCWDAHILVIRCCINNGAGHGLLKGSIVMRLTSLAVIF